MLLELTTWEELKQKLELKTPKTLVRHKVTEFPGLDIPDKKATVTRPQDLTDSSFFQKKRLTAPK